MLAAGHIAKEPEKYGFGDLDYEQPLAYEIAWVPGATDLSLIAQAAGVDRWQVLDLNPQLTRERTPSGRGWPVRLPAGTTTAFRQGFPRLYRLALASGANTGASLAPSGRTHRVRRGETLGGIARRYGMTVSALRAVNGNVQPRRLQPGRTLRLPSASATRAAQATAATAAPPRTAQARSHTTTRSAADARLHTVRRGEKLRVTA